MDLKLFPRLSTRSRRAIQRTKKRGGDPYIYRPRGTLMARLAQETGMSVTEVYRQLLREREVLIRGR